MTDDVRKLLGGYATGTLTEAEQSALFRAALEDEQLFAALADEQALKELLDDPAARAELLQAAERPQRQSFWKWVAPLGVLSAATLAAVLTFQFYRATPEPVTPTLSAKVEAPKKQEVLVPPPGHAQILRPAPAPVEAKKAEAPTEAPLPPAVMPYAQPPVSARKEAAEEEKQKVQVAAESRSVEVVASAPRPMQEEAKPVRMADRAAPAAALMASRVSKKVAPSIEYSILKQTASGEFVAVPNDAVFRKDDSIRIKIHLAGPGTVELRQGANVIASQTLAVQQDQTLPLEGSIALSAGTTLQLVVHATPSTIQTFTPGNVQPGSLTIQLRTE